LIGWPRPSLAAALDSTKTRPATVTNHPAPSPQAIPDRMPPVILTRLNRPSARLGNAHRTTRQNDDGRHQRDTPIGMYALVALRTERRFGTVQARYVGLSLCASYGRRD
jgi:hypothetical protein